MRAQILNEIGNVVNTVVADVAYLDAKYPGHWREEILFDEDGNPSPPPAEEVVALVDDPDTIAFVGYVQQQGYITA